MKPPPLYMREMGTDTDLNVAGTSSVFTPVSNVITDRQFSVDKSFPVADTESCCQKNSSPLQRQICRNVSRKSLTTDADSV